MSNAVVNHAIATSLNRSYSVNVDPSTMDFGSEIIEYAIIEKAYVSSIANANIAYTLDLVHKANYVANPRLDDPFSNGMQSA